MPLKQRIAAGGIVVVETKILLVRYADANKSYLVAPGGAIEDGESLAVAAEREVYEETGVHCQAKVPIMIENIRAAKYQMVKIWYLCDFIEGEIAETLEAQKEGIMEVGWFSDAELENETVFPDIIKRMKIKALTKFAAQIIDSGVRHANF